MLLLIAYFKEKRKGNPYVAWAYHKAAENIEDLGESIKEIHRKKRLMSIPGVGERLAGIISDFLDTGECEQLERLKTG